MRTIAEDGHAPQGRPPGLLLHAGTQRRRIRDIERMAPEQVVENPHREFGRFVIGRESPVDRSDLNVVSLFLYGRHGSHLAQPASNTDDLPLVVEQGSLLLHRMWDEEHTISQDSVDWVSETGLHGTRDRWLLPDEARSIIPTERHGVRGAPGSLDVDTVF